MIFEARTGIFLELDDILKRDWVGSTQCSLSLKRAVVRLNGIWILDHQASCGSEMQTMHSVVRLCEVVFCTRLCAVYWRVLHTRFLSITMHDPDFQEFLVTSNVDWVRSMIAVIRTVSLWMPHTQLSRELM